MDAPAMMQKNEPTSQDHTISAGPPTLTLDVKPTDMLGITLTAVKQNANDIKPSKPRYSSWTYPI